MDSNTTFEDEFMTDEEVIGEFGLSADEFMTDEEVIEEFGLPADEFMTDEEVIEEFGLSADEFMTDQEVVEEFGSDIEGEEFLSDSEVLREFGQIFERVEKTVQKVESGKATLIESDEIKLPLSAMKKKTSPDKSDGTGTAKTTIAPEHLGSTDMEEKGRRNTFVADAFTEAKEKRDKFLSTKRFGLFAIGERPEVVAVKKSIRALNHMLEQKVPQLDTDYAFQIESICLGYISLINNCKEYEKSFEKIEKPSRAEEKWLNLSYDIAEQSDKELGNFKLIKGAYINGIRPKGDFWTDILFSVRANPLAMRIIETVGEGSSTVHVVGNGKNQRFVKYEERMAESQEAAHRMDLANPSFDKNGQLRTPKETEFRAATRDAKIDAGMTISDRNASSSRVAERLGLSEIVAKSDTILVRDEKGVYRANAMESVRGENVLDMRTLVERVQESPEDKELYGKEISFSGKAARQMFELQIFDLITGQTDRNPGNYRVFYEIRGNTVQINGIKAIDNDISFGKISAEHSVGTLYALSDKNDDDEEIASIPFISQELYDRLMMPGLDLVLKYDQLDLRTDSEIKALLDRFTFVRNKVRDLCQRGLMEIVNDDEELERRYKDRMKSLKEKGKLARGFLSHALIDTIASSQNGNFLGSW